MYRDIETTKAKKLAGSAVNDDSIGNDDEIIRKVLAGDRDLFRELVSRHKNLVIASILRQVGSRDLAEDLAQQTFVRAYTGLRTFRFEARFSSWLLRIALNTTATHFASRAFKEQQRLTSYDAEIHDASDNSNSEEVKSAHRKMEQFRSALATLPVRLREPLVLCGLEARSYQEAAEILNIPLGTVRSRLNHARLRLRTAMTAEENS